MVFEKKMVRWVSKNNYLKHPTRNVLIHGFTIRIVGNEFLKGTKMGENEMEILNFYETVNLKIRKANFF